MTVKQICLKIKRKIKKLYVRYFTFVRLNYNLNDANYNWKTYYYFKKKYKKYLKNYKKIEGTNELSNKVWWCWLQGEDEAPEICKACLNSLRKNLKDRDVVVITLDNYSKYVEIPEFILNKYRKGIISHTHFSDILRLQLLITHGGTWIDSSVLCTGYNPDFFDKKLFMFSNFLKEDKSIVTSNWFITSEKSNPILVLTRDLIFEYWKNNNVLINYYFFHIFFKIATEKYYDLWEEIHCFPNTSPHVLQFEFLKKFENKRWKEICYISSIHKLTQKADFSKADDNSFYNYIIKKYK